MNEAFDKQGATAIWMSPAETAAFRAAEEKRLAPVIKASGAKVEYVAPLALGGRSAQSRAPAACGGASDRGLDDGHFMRRPHDALEEIAAALGAVAQTQHRVHVHAGMPSSPVARSPRRLEPSPGCRSDRLYDFLARSYQPTVARSKAPNTSATRRRGWSAAAKSAMAARPPRRHRRRARGPSPAFSQTSSDCCGRRNARSQLAAAPDRAAHATAAKRELRVTSRTAGRPAPCRTSRGNSSMNGHRHVLGAAASASVLKLRTNLARSKSRRNSPSHRPGPGAPRSGDPPRLHSHARAEQVIPRREQAAKQERGQHGEPTTCRQKSTRGTQDHPESSSRPGKA